MSRYRVIGINDDQDTCECCGKSGLKRVVWIENADTQEVKCFGTTCAASPAKGFGVDKEIKSAIRQFESEQQAALANSHRKYRQAGGKYAGNGSDGWKPADTDLWNGIFAKTLEAFKINAAKLRAA